MKKVKILSIINEIYCRFQDDEVPALSAQLTFYLTLSFFPFLLFILTLLSYTPIGSDLFLSFLGNLLPKETYTLVYHTLKETAVYGTIRESIKLKNSTTLLSFGMITTLWSASNGVNSVIRGLNKAYNEEETRSYLKLRALSLIFTVVLSVTILLSLALIVFGRVIGLYLLVRLGLNHWFSTLWIMFRHLIMISTIFVVLLFLYKYMPNRKLFYKEVLPGTIFSTIFWVLLSNLFSKYVNNFGRYNIMYGSIAGIIILLLWLYMSSIVLLIGGEINGVLTFAKKGEVKPKCKKFGFPIPFSKKKKKTS
ncbi:MAG: YihY/virulence factor BrkB family protein [Epulopiscium sp.]|jgi:membrane protein|nr:YihY/virulence factor BrkB family protein [Candidatus Epulonipiscium sp.]